MDLVGCENLLVQGRWGMMEDLDLIFQTQEPVLQIKDLKSSLMKSCCYKCWVHMLFGGS